MVHRIRDCRASVRACLLTAATHRTTEPGNPEGRQRRVRAELSGQRGRPGTVVLPDKFNGKVEAVEGRIDPIQNGLAKRIVNRRRFLFDSLTHDLRIGRQRVGFDVDLDPVHGRSGRSLLADDHGVSEQLQDPDFWILCPINIIQVFQKVGDNPTIVRHEECVEDRPVFECKGPGDRWHDPYPTRSSQWQLGPVIAWKTNHKNYQYEDIGR